jgi:hypothetical protein
LCPPASSHGLLHDFFFHDVLVGFEILHRTPARRARRHHGAGVATLGQRDLPVTKDGEHAGDVLAQDRETHHVVELAGGELKAEVEHLAAVLRQPVLELLVVELTKF